MCGGIVGAFSLRHSETSRQRNMQLSYNAGRIGSYVLAGTLAGSAGAGGLLLDGLLPVRPLLYALASLLLVIQGLHVAGVGRGLPFLERAGSKLWACLQPWSRSLLPVDLPRKAFLLGALWGWLPCGMVYSALVVALASGHPASGAAIMLAFGLGTLPNLLALGFAAGRLRPRLGIGKVRVAAGALIFAFGAIGLARIVQPGEISVPSLTPGAHAHVRAGH
jgi:sulfite exporter TauE/SafE